MRAGGTRSWRGLKTAPWATAHVSVRSSMVAGGLIVLSPRDSWAVVVTVRLMVSSIAQVFRLIASS
jgi:hypothetical protein